MHTHTLTHGTYPTTRSQQQGQPGFCLTHEVPSPLGVNSFLCKPPRKDAITEQKEQSRRKWEFMMFWCPMNTRRSHPCQSTGHCCTAAMKSGHVVVGTRVAEQDGGGFRPNCVSKKSSPSGATLTSLPQLGSEVSRCIQTPRSN